jgi:SAM-dependent methyltransferase
MPTDPFDSRVVGAAYGTTADDYETAFADDLARLLVDIRVLDDAADRFPSHRPVLDIGCGPGQVGAYLVGRGASVVGVDLAPEMLKVAHRRAPELRLVCADMRSLPVRSGSCGGVVSFYSVQHVVRSDLPVLLRELRRVLSDDGVLVVATHLGEGEVVTEEFLGRDIEPVGGTFYTRAELEEALTSAGFHIEAICERNPLAHEYPSQRIYLTSRRGRRRARE